MQSFAGYAQALWGWGLWRLPKAEASPTCRPRWWASSVEWEREGGSRGLFGSHAGWPCPSCCSQSFVHGPPLQPLTRRPPHAATLDSGPGAGFCCWTPLRPLRGSPGWSTESRECYHITWSYVSTQAHPLQEKKEQGEFKGASYKPLSLYERFCLLFFISLTKTAFCTFNMSVLLPR